MECIICADEFKDNQVFKCSECKSIVCHSCLQRCIIESVEADAHCPKCDVILSLKDIYKVIGKRDYIERLTKAAVAKEKALIPFIMQHIDTIRLIYDTCTNTEKYNALKSMTGYVGPILGTFPNPIKNADNENIIYHYRDVIHSIYDEYLKCKIPFAFVKAYTSMDGTNTDIKINMPLNDFKHILDLLMNRTQPEYNAFLSLVETFKTEYAILPALNKTDCHREIYEERERIDGYIKLYEKCHVLPNLYKYCTEPRFLMESIARYVYYTWLDNTGQTKKSEYKTLLFKCPKNDCEGYIDDEYTCALCQTKYCENCLSPINPDEEHTCKKEDIKSFTEIKKSTKPCPKCAARIFRSEGCAQMFCTQCHTGFDWNTGEIIKTNFHNPHRMEWLRTLGFNEFNNININCNEQFRINFVLHDEIQIVYYSQQANHIRDIVRTFQTNVNEITSNAMRIKLATRLVKTVLDNEAFPPSTYYKEVKTEILKLKKQQFLITIINNYLDPVDILLRSANKLIGDHINSKITSIMAQVIRNEIARVSKANYNPYANDVINTITTTTNTIKPIDKIFPITHTSITKEVWKQYLNHFDLIRNVIDNANKELKLYTELFGLRSIRAIGQDHHGLYEYNLSMF